MKRNFICLVLLLAVFQTPAQLYDKKSMMNDHAFFQALSSFYWLKGYDAFPYITNTINRKPVYNLYDCKSGELVEKEIEDSKLAEKLKEHYTVKDNDIKNKLQPGPDKVLSDLFVEGQNSDTATSSKQLIAFANSKLDVSEINGGISDNIINGFVNFLITAAKKEIKLSFFDQLKSLFDNEKYPELKTLFPETYSYISGLDDIDLNEAFTALQTPIKTDLKNVLSNVKGLLSLEKYRTLIKSDEKLKPLVLLTGVLDVFNQLVIIKERNITAVVDHMFQDKIYLDADYIMKPVEVFNSVSTLSKNFSYLPSIVFKSKELSDSWIDIETFNSYGKDETFRKLFKFYLQKNIYGTTFPQAPTVSNDDITLYKKTINALRELGAAWSSYTASKNLVAADPGDKTVGSNANKAVVDEKSLSQVLTGFRNLISVTSSFMETNNAAGYSALKPGFELATAITGSSAKIAGFISNENYPLAVLEVSRLVWEQLNKRHEQLAQAKKNAKGKEKEDVKTQLSALDDFNIYGTKEKLLRYGLFLANIATADNSDEVSKAIETFALPPGSSRVKKINKVTLGLNAYVGYSYSFNNLDKYPYLKKRESAVTAPLGLDLSFGLGRKVKWYMGVGATILDVGAIFSYKVKNDSTTVSDINFANIFSPGIKGHLGFPLFKNGWNIPITLSGGYQWGPRIKAVDNLKVSTLPELVGRWQLCLAIDIPIMHFINVRK
jgi:hypothetical protein